MLCVFVGVFFFKQKTAYEMRISDWSSDVCSSDLYLGLLAGGSMLKKMVQTTLRLRGGEGVAIFEIQGENKAVRNKIKELVNAQQLDGERRAELDRKSVV